MFLYSLMLTAALGAADADRLVVENESLAVTVDRAMPAVIASLRHKPSGREMAVAKRPAPLFRFLYSDDKQPAAKPYACHAGQAKRIRVEPFSRGDDRGARFVFEEFDGRPFKFACTLVTRPGDRLVRCGLEVELPAGVHLESIEYPIVRLRLPLAPGVREAAVVGDAKGGVYHPADWKPRHSLRNNQPGSLAAAFGCYYDAAGGLYTGAYDSHGYRKTLVMSRMPEALEVAWYHPCFDQDQFALKYDVVLAGFAGLPGQAADWRDAADLYKAWAVRQPWCAKRFAERDDVPAWLKQGAAIVRFTRAWLSEPEQIEAWFHRYWQQQFPAHTPLVVAYWGWEHVGKWVGPEYFPAYPSDERFRQLVQLGRSMNGHTFLWPSGYNYSLNYAGRPDGSFQWDIRPQFEASDRRHTVVERNGAPQIRDCPWIRGGQNAAMCPGDPWTIDWLNRAAVGCCQRGAEVVQIDQVVGANFPPCYSREHGHAPGPGPWATEVFHRQLQTMLRACRAVEPDAVVGFEEPNERFIQEIGIQDYRDCDLLWRGIEPASVFSYLYHEYLPTLFQSNRAQSGHDPLALAWCLVEGQMPHLAPRVGLGRGPMIVDGGFERASDEGPVEFARTMKFPGDSWFAGETAIDRQQRHSGRSSLKLHNLNARDSAMAAQNYDVNEHLRPGVKYRLSVWIRSEGIQPNNGVVVNALAPGLTLLESWTIPYPAEQATWTRGQVDFTLPAGTVNLRIRLTLKGSGAVWLDDLKLEQVLADGRTTEVQRPELPADHGLMQAWIDLYHGAGRPYLALGRMLHPPELRTGPAVQLGELRFAPVLHNAFQAADGSQAVVLANWTATAQQATLNWKQRSRRITLQPQEVRLVRE
jgi:hypothetical protein